jgi:hypothetical protein
LNLNGSQMHALQQATTNRVTLVQGPPGTGKTAVACQIVEQWVRNRSFGGSGVLCCSDSNIAVDNMLDGLVKKGINCLRLGRPESTSPHLLQYSLDGMLEQQLGPNPDPQSKFDAKQRIISNAGVVCCTCIGAGSAVLKGKRTGKGKGKGNTKGFAGVLIDEAAQATEIAAVVAAGLGCQQLVLVGDHHQLPPTVLSDQSQAEGLALSLFERLVQAGVSPCVLDTQYRMVSPFSPVPVPRASSGSGQPSETHRLFCSAPGLRAQPDSAIRLLQHPAIAEFPSDCFVNAAHSPSHPLTCSLAQPASPPGLSKTSLSFLPAPLLMICVRCVHV